MNTPATLRASIEHLAEQYGEQYPQAEKFLTELDGLDRKLQSTDRNVHDSAGKEFLELQQKALRAHPVLHNNPVLFVARQQYLPDHHNTATMFVTDETNTRSFRGGGALKLLDVKTGKVTTIVDAVKDGMVRDPEINFDATQIVFSLRTNIQDNYHIYVVRPDGAGMKQLTSEQGIADIDPLYLPDGGIVFTSTREPKYCMCNIHIMGNLFRMEGDGANIHQIGKSTLHEGHSALMPDGRIMYDRWEYVDRNFGNAQGLWSVNPDGTSHALIYGNNTDSPGAVIDGRIVSESHNILCIFSSCHDRPWGALALLDRGRGVEGRSAVIRTWPPNAIELVDKGGFDMFTQVNPKYEDPFPLDDAYFLVSRMTGSGEHMGIYLVDLFGNEILLHEEEQSCFDPMPIIRRPKPPVIPVRRTYTDEPGCFYLQDVYKGTHMVGVERGAVAYLRVIESPEKRFWTNPSWNGQGVHRPALNWHSFENKRILGTVPVEEDGSAYVEVPPDTFVYFQLLDKNGKMIQSMRSGTIIQAGEIQGCIGCHESRYSAPVAGRDKLPLACTQPPRKLDGWHGQPRLFSFQDEVQPVFDKHCVSCHDYGKPAGEKLNLAGDRTLSFNASYIDLWSKGLTGAIGAGPAPIQQAYSWGSHTSRLIKELEKGHRNVKLSSEELDRLITWIDINATYYPSYASAYPNNPFGRSPLDNSQLNRLRQLTGAPFVGGHGPNQRAQVSFRRPELSRCLEGIADKESPEYREALAIIQAGAAMLQAWPRADMSGFTPCETDRLRQEKYDRLRDRDKLSRAACMTGQKIYDLEL